MRIGRHAKPTKPVTEAWQKKLLRELLSQGQYPARRAQDPNAAVRLTQVLCSIPEYADYAAIVYTRSGKWPAGRRPGREDDPTESKRVPDRELELRTRRAIQFLKTPSRMAYIATGCPDFLQNYFGDASIPFLYANHVYAPEDLDRFEPKAFLDGHDMSVQTCQELIRYWTRLGRMPNQEEEINTGKPVSTKPAITTTTDLASAAIGAAQRLGPYGTTLAATALLSDAIKSLCAIHDRKTGGHDRIALANEAAIKMNAALYLTSSAAQANDSAILELIENL